MTAAGTITLARASPVHPTPPYSIQMFVEKEFPSKQSFDTTQCFSRKEFTLLPKQKCVLITNLEASSAKLNNNINGDDPLSFDRSKKYKLCYSIKVIKPDMAVTVGEKTPLSLLINSGCITAVQCCVPSQEWFELYFMQLQQQQPVLCPPEKRKRVYDDAAAAAAAAAADDDDDNEKSRAFPAAKKVCK